MELVFVVSAWVSIISVVLITVYIFAAGLPPIIKIGVSRFIFGTQWKPTAESPNSVFSR